MSEFESILNGHGLAKFGCAHCEFTCGDKCDLEDHVNDEHGVNI